MGLALLNPKRTDVVEEIESVRMEMVKLGTRYGMLHPDVQRCSRQLDELLNQYYDMAYEPKKLVLANA